MKCKIETSNGIMFLKGIDGDKRLEIADYIELHDSSLLMVSLILDKKEYFDWGKNHVIYTKLWGCIDSMMNVVVPFIYQHMQIEFNYIRAEKDNSHYLEGYDSYYFNMHGVPVIYSTKKEMPGWDWVKDSDYKRISIAQKDGKQGVVRNDGSVFVEPIYKKVEINFSNPEIIVTSDDNIRTSIVYRKDEKAWRFLPIGHRYIYFSYDLYVLVNQNDLEYAVDKQFIYIFPFSSKNSNEKTQNKELDKPQNLIIAIYQGRYNTRNDLFRYYTNYTSKKDTFIDLLNVICEVCIESINNQDLSQIIKDRCQKVYSIVKPILEEEKEVEYLMNVTGKERDSLMFLHNSSKKLDVSKQEAVIRHLSIIADSIIITKNKLTEENNRNTQSLTLSMIGIILTILFSLLSLLSAENFSALHIYMDYIK